MAGDRWSARSPAPRAASGAARGQRRRGAGRLDPGPCVYHGHRAGQHLDRVAVQLDGLRTGPSCAPNRFGVWPAMAHREITVLGSPLPMAAGEPSRHRRQAWRLPSIPGEGIELRPVGQKLTMRPAPATAWGFVPALPPAILEPLWDQFAALLPHRDDAHPLGCHRARIPDRVIFDKLIQVLVFGCGYRRIADHTCSATTLRRRHDEWITLGLAEQLRLLVLGAYDRMPGLELTHLAVDGCITKTPCGGQTAGPSPVDRAKQGGKRSVAVEADGIPLGAVAAPANRRDDGLLAATPQGSCRWQDLRRGQHPGTAKPQRRDAGGSGADPVPG
jgi:transposase